jgi:hypothetical protein
MVMRLTIKNISSIKKIDNHERISINDVEVEQNQYVIFFWHKDYGSFEASLKRDKLQNFQVGWSIHLRPDDAHSKSYDYPIYRDDVLGPFNFLDFLNNICHDWDILNNK